VLKWERAHDCPCDAWNTRARGPFGTGTWRCCDGRGSTTVRRTRRRAVAADGGHLNVLRWAREHGSPCYKRMCGFVASIHPETLAWVRAQPSQAHLIPMPHDVNQHTGDAHRADSRRLARVHRCLRSNDHHVSALLGSMNVSKKRKTCSR
jgi:hypothetical protein